MESQKIYGEVVKILIVFFVTICCRTVDLEEDGLVEEDGSIILKNTLFEDRK